MSGAAERDLLRRTRAVLAANWLLPAAVLALIGCLAVLGGAQTVDGPYGQFDVQVATGELVASARAGQTFITDQPGLDRIDVYLGDFQRPNRGPLVLHVKAAPSDEADLASVTIDATQVHGDGYVTFGFQPLPEPPDTPLGFWLEAPQAQPGNAVTVLGTTTDAYAGGVALFDHMPANEGVQDLAFRLYYRPGVGEAVTTLLARQAQGRPTIFGAPALYLGLAAAYILGLVVLLGLAVSRLRL